jgi:hypothetical protein
VGWGEEEGKKRGCIQAFDMVLYEHYSFSSTFNNVPCRCLEGDLLAPWRRHPGIVVLSAQSLSNEDAFEGANLLTLPLHFITFRFSLMISCCCESWMTVFGFLYGNTVTLNHANKSPGTAGEMHGQLVICSNPG